MGAAEVLEHSEHISHAGGHGHGGGDDKLGTRVGITMACLGVLLAFCSAKVGGERTELVKVLVEQQHAHAKYQAQDIKHRSAINALRQIHSEILDPAAVTALDADLGKLEADAAPAAPPVAPAGSAAPAAGSAAPVAAPAPKADTTSVKAARLVAHQILGALSPNRTDAGLVADTADRYAAEAAAANDWVESFSPAIDAHVEAQEQYEMAQLFAEIGIVVASVALLMKKKVAWFVALALGLASIVFVGKTYARTSHEVHEAEEKIEHTGKHYRDLRTAGKTTVEDEALSTEIHTWSGHARKAPAAGHGEGDKGGHDKAAPEKGSHGEGKEKGGHDKEEKPAH